MSTVLWIVGEPGVGKTTLVRELITWAGPRTARDVKPKWDLYGDRMATAGHYDGQPFDGADRLPISDIYPALAHWAAYFSDVPLTVLDGDKLATARARASVTIQSPFIRQLCVRVTDNPAARAGRRDRCRTQRGSKGGPPRRTISSTPSTPTTASTSTSGTAPCWIAA